MISKIKIITAKTADDLEERVNDFIKDSNFANQIRNIKYLVVDGGSFGYNFIAVLEV